MRGTATKQTAKLETKTIPVSLIFKGKAKQSTATPKSQKTFLRQSLGPSEGGRRRMDTRCQSGPEAGSRFPVGAVRPALALEQAVLLSKNQAVDGIPAPLALFCSAEFTVRETVGMAFCT
jgi:hypothetical protein